MEEAHFTALPVIYSITRQQTEKKVRCCAFIYKHTHVYTMLFINFLLKNSSYGLYTSTIVG